MPKPECYFQSEECAGELWTCETCQEQFCQTHWHRTDKGVNVECVGCENNRPDYDRDFPDSAGGRTINSNSQFYNE